jgi:hypothetical protein
MRVNMRRYRFLTGPDDRSFCDRVTEAINEGWELFGDPQLTFDAVKGRVICGQAIIREEPENQD